MRSHQNLFFLGRAHMELVATRSKVMISLGFKV